MAQFGTGAPGTVTINEYSNTAAVIPNVSSTIGAFAGVFIKGPINTPILISSANQLANTFGEPSVFSNGFSYNPETWWTCANFLSYGNQLWVCRADATLSNSVTAVANTGVVASFTPFTNATINNTSYVQYTQNSVNALSGLNVNFCARHPGGYYYNSLAVSQCDTAEQFSSNVNLLNIAHSNSTANNVGANVAGTNATFNVGSNSILISLSNGATFTSLTTTALASLLANTFAIGDYITVGNTSTGSQSLQIANIGPVITVNTAGTNTGVSTLQLNFTLPWTQKANCVVTTLPRRWEFATLFNGPPGQSTYCKKYGNTAANDEMHIVVYDELGYISKLNGNVLETYGYVSRIQPAVSTYTKNKVSFNGSSWIRNVLVANSAWIYWCDDRVGAGSTSNALAVASSTNYSPALYTFIGGIDGVNENNAAVSDLADAWETFADVNAYDIDICLSGQADAAGARASYIINNIIEERGDCVGVFSPPYSVVANTQSQLNAILAYYALLPTTNRAIVDNNYKYQLDWFSNVYRWLPCNGDVGGLLVRADSSPNGGPWISPAGYNNGQLKNTVKLLYQAQGADLVALNNAQINAIIAVKGIGPAVLMNDTTFSSQPDPFQEIGIRRLFLELEKAISTYAKYDLFAFNDAFTQAQFVTTVIPYLQNLQALNAFQNFLVVCDSTTNTPAVVNSQQFVGNIFIMPNYSIHWIGLNFVSVPTGVSFTTISVDF